MLAVRVKDLQLQEFWVDAVPSQHIQVIFPLLGRGQENEETSLVYFELEPGNETGSHTDSAEEVLHIIQGRAEVTVGDETAVVEGPAFAVVPTLVPHNLRNVGTETVKVAGFFPSRYLVSHFDNTWQPTNSKVVKTQELEHTLAVAQ